MANIPSYQQIQYLEKYKLKSKKEVMTEAQRKAGYGRIKLAYYDQRHQVKSASYIVPPEVYSRYRAGVKKYQEEKRQAKERQETILEEHRSEAAAKDQALRQKYNLSESDRIVHVDQKTYKAIKKNPNAAILGNKLYESRGEAAKAAINESMGDRYNRAVMAENWEQKKQITQFYDDVRQYHTEAWQQKKDQARIDEGLLTDQQVNKLVDHKKAIEQIKLMGGAIPKDSDRPDQARAQVDKLLRSNYDPRGYDQAKAEYLDLVQANGQPFIKSDFSKPLDQAQKDLMAERAFSNYSIMHPVQSARTFSEQWGRGLELQHEQNTRSYQSGINARMQLGQEQLQALASQQTQDPKVFQDLVSQELPKVSLKDTGKYIGSSAFLGVAQGAKGVLIDTPLHPVRTVTGLAEMATNPAKALKSIGSEFSNNPIKTITQTATSIYLWGKIGQGVKRILKPKIKETPIKAKEIRVHKTTRASGSKTEIHIETVTGKAKERWFWQKSKIKPRKKIAVELDRTAKSNFKGMKHTQQAGKIKGELHLDGSKAKLKIKDYTETRPPTEILDPAQSYSGTTRSGTPIKGTTPKLRKNPNVVISKKTRAAYQYDRIIKTDLFDWDTGGKYPWVKKQTVQVPTKTSNMVQVTGHKVFVKNTELPSHLILEEQLRGNFVKFKRSPTGKAPGATGTTPKPGSSSVIAQFADDGSFKLLSTVESGKNIPYVGPKPSGGRVPSQGLTGQLVTRQSQASAPVIDVLKSDPGAAAPKLIPIIQPPKTTKSTSKSILSPTFDVLNPLEESKVSSPLTLGSSSGSPEDQKLVLNSLEILTPEEGQKIDPIIDVVDKSRSKDPIVDIFTQTDTKSNTITTPDIGQGQDQVIEPVVDIAQDQQRAPRPIQFFKSLQLTDTGIDFSFQGTEEAPKPKSMRVRDEEENVVNLFQGFDIWIRKKGKFQKLNTKGSLSREEALFEGARAVDTTPAASFKITPSRDPVMSRGKGLVNLAVLDKFYQKDEVFIEKQKYRINTMGEVEGISRLGQMARSAGSFFTQARRELPKMMDNFAVPSLANQGKNDHDNLFGGILK